MPQINEDEKLIRSVISTVRGSSLDWHIEENEHLFLSRVLSEETLRPKTHPFVSRVLLTSAARSYEGSYLNAINREDSPISHFELSECDEILEMAVADAEELGYALTDLDVSSIREANSFVSALLRKKAEKPLVYYSALGFVCGESDGVRERRNGAARYYSERNISDDELLSKFSRKAAEEAFQIFSEDVYLTCPESKSDRQDERFSSSADLLIGEIASATENFARRTCASMGGEFPQESVLEAWTSLYAYHCIFGFVEALLDQRDSDDDMEAPRFEEEESAAFLPFSTAIGSENDIMTACLHMKSTWKSDRKQRFIGPSDMYWTVCGTAYADGAALAVEYMPKRNETLAIFQWFAIS